MSRSPSGFWVNNILDQFAWELSGILQDNLVRRPYSRDRLDMQILLTLSKRVYADRLLFRDLAVKPVDAIHNLNVTVGSTSSQVQVHDQAIEYLYRVLARPLSLAQNLLDKPTSMHTLYLLLCRCGPAQAGWDRADIQRQQLHDVAPPRNHQLLTTARLFQRLCMQLGDRYSDIARRRRAEFGPLWLTIDNDAIELPEELSLFDLMEAVPKPLNNAINDDRKIQNQLNRVLKSLNERYMLLRACGLNPAQWLERDWPSIANLRDTRKLRQHSHQSLALGQWQNIAKAYEKAFVELKGDKKKFAGCTTFSELAESETGAVLLGPKNLTIDQSGNLPDDVSLALMAANSDDVNEHELTQLIESLLRSRPELFDPLMTYYFRQALGLGRSMSELLQDVEYNKLVQADPVYADLDDQSLFKTLRGRAEVIVEQQLQHG